MARGWESKSVESQIEDRREPVSGDRDEIAQSNLELTRKREGLESSRRGIVRELESATSDLRRQSLQAALAHLDAELKKFD